MDPRQKALLQRVRVALRDVQALEDTVSTGNHEAFATQVNQLVESLRQLTVNQDWLSGGGSSPIEIPVEIVRALDAGTNPDTSTAGLFKQGLQANQAAKGKAEALNSFRHSLFQEAQKAFPEAAASYQALKDTVVEDQGQTATVPDTSTSAA